MLPLLYLHGLSSCDCLPVLEQFLGSSTGLSPATVTRLTQQWQADHAAFMDRDLPEVDYAYAWADGIHLNVRLEEAKACVLVLVGLRADGSKELVAFKDGYRESGESWATCCGTAPAEGCARPGPGGRRRRTGLLEGSGRGLPVSRHQRCWRTKPPTRSTLRRSRLRPGARKALQDIYNTDDRDFAVKAITTFTQLYGAKFP